MRNSDTYGCCVEYYESLEDLAWRSFARWLNNISWSNKWNSFYIAWSWSYAKHGAFVEISAIKSCFHFKITTLKRSTEYIPKATLDLCS